MNKRIWALAIAWALSLAACEDENPNEQQCKPGDEQCKIDEKPHEQQCEPGDEQCEVGDGKCVVGYDGDCWPGQVCFAGEGAPKGKPGVCTDGQFGANGQLVAVAVLQGFKQDGRDVRWQNLRVNGGDGECFSVSGLCPVLAMEDAPPPWLNKAPATLIARVHGPHAETEQLKIAVRGMEHEGCVNIGSTLEGRQWWECVFPEENWAGENTTEMLELKLWTENTPEFPRSSFFYVDTLPLELRLEPDVLSGTGWRGFQGVFVQKIGASRETTTDFRAAPLAKVEYLRLEVLIDNAETLATSAPMNCIPWYTPGESACYIPLRFDFLPSSTLTIRATGVKATDLAGNEVSYDELTATWPL